MSPSQTLNGNLANLKLEDDRIPNVVNVLNPLATSYLCQLLINVSKPRTKVPVSKPKNYYIMGIVDLIWGVALEAFFALMSNKDKNDTIRFLGIDDPETVRGAIKATILTSFKNDHTTFIHLLENEYTDEQILQFCENYDLDLSTLNTRQDKVEELLHTLRFNSTSAFYNFLAVDDVRHIAGAAGLKTSGTKHEIITRLIVQEDETQNPRTRTVDPDRSAIEKGITFETLFNKYYVHELQEHCKAYGIKAAGTKRELINRILKFLDGNTAGIMSGDKKVKRRHNTDGIIKKKKKVANKENELAPEATSGASTTTAIAKKSDSKPKPRKTVTIVQEPELIEAELEMDAELASQEIAEPRRSRSNSKSGVTKKDEPKSKTPTATPSSPAAHSRVTRKSIETPPVPEPDNNEDEEGDEDEEDEDEEGEEEEEEQVEVAPMDLDEIVSEPLKPKRGQVNNEMNKKVNVPTSTTSTTTTVASAPSGNRVMSPNRKIIAQPMTSAPIATAKKVVPTTTSTCITTRRR